VKKFHPTTPIVFGGLSSTYYHQELLERPEIDFVVRGDSTEKAMLALMDELRSGSVSFADVPNLSWKRGEKIVVNPMAHAGRPR